MNLSIKTLRQRGYKVRVIHDRKYTKDNVFFGVQHKRISPRGGLTTIELTTPDKKITVSGKAKCSIEDNYNKKVGNSIALGRAFKSLHEKLNGVEVFMF